MLRLHGNRSLHSLRKLSQVGILCAFVYTSVGVSVRMRVCMYVCMHVCMHVWNACTDACVVHASECKRAYTIHTHTAMRTGGIRIFLHLYNPFCVCIVSYVCLFANIPSCLPGKTYGHALSHVHQSVQMPLLHRTGSELHTYLNTCLSLNPHLTPRQPIQQSMLVYANIYIIETAHMHVNMSKENGRRLHRLPQGTKLHRLCTYLLAVSRL